MPDWTPTDSINNWSDARTVSTYVQLSQSPSAETLSMSDGVSTASSFRFSNRMIILMEIRLSSGTRYLSSDVVRHPSRIYREDVVSFGTVERSIPSPASFSRIGDVTVILKDRDRTYRKLFASEAARNVIAVLKIGPNGGSESNFLNIYRGKIVSASFPPGRCNLTITDILFETFKETLPPLVTSSNFTLPEGVNEAFAPIIYGDLDTSGTSGQGALQCIPMTTSRYLIARHPIKAVTAVYTSGDVEFDVAPASPDSFSDSSFETRREYSSYGGSWSLTEEVKSIGGTSYTFTYLDFGTALSEGTQVRVDVQGIKDTSNNLIENPANIIKHFIETWAGIEANSENFDLSSFISVESTCDTASYVGAYAYTDSMTYAEGISRILQSFNIDLFCNVAGRISVALTTSNPGSPLNFDDTEHILINSVTEELPTSIYNKLNYKYGFIPASREWYSSGTYDNTGDQTAIGENLEEEVNLHYVHGGSIATTIVTDMGKYVDLSATNIRFSLSGPRVVDRIDLADVISLDHYEGLDGSTGIYDDKLFKIVGLTFNLDTFQYIISAVARV